MARLLTLDSCPVFLRNALLHSLRPCDEAILLPQAWKSQESQGFKNIVFRLSGDNPAVDASIFSQDWFTGISLIRLSPADAQHVESILSNPSSKQRILDELKNSIVSEIADASVVVGPPLRCDDDERDMLEDQWKCGFDSTSCFVGLYSADHSKIPENGFHGTNRVHKQYFLACKAGCGSAAATFHSRLLASLSKGDSLDKVLETGDAPGARGVRRLSTSATRNRTRILLQAATIIGLSDVQSVPDHAARSASERIAVCNVDVSSNVIRKLESTTRSTWQYSTGVDGVASKGLISLSNAGDGLVLFLTSSGEERISLKNEAWGCIPSSSKRQMSGKDMASSVSEQYKKIQGHPDKQWIHSRFSWKNRQFSDYKQVDIEPFALWGSHEPEKFVHSFSRELGLDSFQAVRLRPELVCCSGVDSGKLRAIVKAVE